MKFKRFDANTCQGTGRSHDPFLRIVRSGTISFSTGAIELMQLTQKSSVAFFQNEESLEDWYIIVYDADPAFRLRWGKTGDKAVVQNAFLAKKILNCAGDGQLKSLRVKLIRSDVKIDDHQAFLLITTIPGSESTDHIELGHSIDNTMEEVKESSRRPYKPQRK